MSWNMETTFKSWLLCAILHQVFQSCKNYRNQTWCAEVLTDNFRDYAWMKTKNWRDVIKTKNLGIINPFQILA